MTISLEALAGLPYQPASPKQYRPCIGVIGCGGISKQHLAAYAAAGFHVTAVCDLRLDAAQARQAEFYPQAQVYSDYHAILKDDNIEVVDIATHVRERPPIVRDAIAAGKHVLSQKPFVLDLDEGQSLVELADKKNCYLAVNQNGRWAPHFSYARLVAQGGFIGQVFGAHLGCYWDHTWVRGTEFEKMKHLILYDYAIHWFDILRCFIPGEAQRVYASTGRVPNQSLAPDLLAQVAVEFESGQATLAFDASVPHGAHDHTFLSGTQGSLHSWGPGILEQTLQVTTQAGSWQPSLKGCWFPGGFHGTMGELLCTIEEKRECVISAADNLHSLALCFAAIESAETKRPVKPGEVRCLPA